MDISAHFPQDNGDEIQPVEKKARPADKVQALNCPRCNSSNTKFCYYNNYNLSQPRYLCKSCRRYWTQGGSLRNVPVGGGSRKNKRSNTSKNSNIKITPTSFSPQIPKLHHHESQNLNLGFNPSHYNEPSNFFAFDPKSFNTTHQNPNLPSSNFSIMGTGNVSSSGLGLSSFMPVPIPEASSAYLSGLPVHHDQFKSGLSFSLYGIENGCGNLQTFQDHINNPSKILFPLEEMKQPVMTTSSDLEKDKVQGDLNGYWNGNSSW